MAIVKHGQIEEYTQIPNDLIRSDKLSPTAFKLFVYLKSLPNNWKINQELIAKDLGISINTITKYIKELKTKKYLQIEKKLNKDENNFAYIYHLYHSPDSEHLNIGVSETNPKNSDTPNLRVSEITSIGNLGEHINKDLINKDLIKKDIINKDIKKEKNTKKEKIQIIDNYFDNQEVNVLFTEFLENRKEVYGKKINTELSIKKLVNKLNKFDDDTKKEMINNSIENGWKGLFEIKPTNKKDKVIGSTDNWYQEPNDNKSIDDEELKKIKARQEKM